LLVVNLGIECWKWWYVVRSEYPDLGYRRSVEATLIGHAVGLLTPGRVGEYLGRVSVLKPGRRWEAGVYTVVDRLFQLSVTLLAGAVAGYTLYSPGWEWGAAAGGIALVLAALYPIPVRVWTRHRLFRHEYVLRSLRLLSGLTFAAGGVLFSLSLVRYLVFSLQYLLLLYSFGGEIAAPTGLALIATVFLLKTLAPVITLTEIGVRESIALWLMPAWGLNEAAVICATFVLFVVNILVPALAGLALFLYRRY
jgi:hypothetical protein